MAALGCAHGPYGRKKGAALSAYIAPRAASCAAAVSRLHTDGERTGGRSGLAPNGRQRRLEQRAASGRREQLVRALPVAARKALIVRARTLEPEHRAELDLARE